MPDTPVASILIPTRGRPEYLDVALRSIAPQAAAAGAELLVVSDGGGASTRSVAERHGAQVIELTGKRGANAARNAGIAASAGDPVLIVDDDVLAPPGWLTAMLDGVHQYPAHDVFGGPIRAVLEGGGPRSCGREKPPVTTLDLGADDRDAELVWSANMAIRRRALQLAGPFDESLSGRAGGAVDQTATRWDSRGDEEEWERRYRARGGSIRYIAAAGLDHRRAPADSRLRELARAAYAQGRRARRFDVSKRSQPPFTGELRTLAGCVWHIFRRRCLNGVVLVAHSSGRVVETITGAG